MRRIALAVVALVVLLLVLAQLFLPGIAAEDLRSQIAKSGSGVSVEIRAFPAVELLWHHADKVVVHIGRYRSSTGHLSSQLDRASGVGTLDVSVGELDAGLLTLRNATLRKRGNGLTGHATVSEADLRSSIPILQSVTPVASGGGRLVLRGTASLLGVSATVDATVGAVNGKLLVTPNIPLGSLATVTVFSDPKIAVQDVSATTAPGGFAVTASAMIH